jgi:hypothetical protein
MASSDLLSKSRVQVVDGEFTVLSEGESPIVEHSSLASILVAASLLTTER